jgi:glyoxylase-like metal-dependent hydrolase (beta-lactamase superfamily II)
MGLAVESPGKSDVEQAPGPIARPAQIFSDALEARSAAQRPRAAALLGERVVLVDTGPPDRAQRGDVVRRALMGAGRRPEDVSLIVATHAHPDHVGNAAALRAWTGAPIAADPNELACFEGRERAATTPTGLAGRLFRLTPLPHQRFAAFTPDILVDADFDLRSFGVAADLHRCGGHTPGSLAVHVPSSGELLAIDLVAGGIGIGGIALHGRVIEPRGRSRTFAHIRMSQGVPLRHSSFANADDHERKR